MSLIQRPLPFAIDALVPHLSVETLDYHYGKHHKAYVDNGNRLIAGTPFETMTPEQIIREASGAVFNNVAQAWNHDFYWHSLTPSATSPAGALEDALARSFGSIAAFKNRFTEAAIGTFGSGWAWLSRRPDGSLAVSSTQGAGNPLTEGWTPLLTCDVWEHAYYIDYRNARPRYVEKFWEIVDWNAVGRRLTTSPG
ncbi:MAG: superoxide dismutase [Panacagrimonas sp.]|jgi:Fe-Mn family superoxide dismutase|nr:superoxide dismutase [Panacagrimonas sp.]MCC2656298.1 superoxide dismutase [Panacagrimonas sp.]